MVNAPSQNHNSRVNYLVIHFTSEHFAESLRLLTQPTARPVSAHYLIPEPDDDTYKRRSLGVHKLVPESRRAWHAGASFWHGEESLNNRSIGIELVNRSYCSDDDPDIETPTPENQSCVFHDFSAEQFALLVRLTGEILVRFPEIDPVDVVGHADIAPDRKVDPGPRFPWRQLYEQGTGAWYDQETVDRYREQYRHDLPDIALIQRALLAYGYRIEETGENDPQTRFVVRAFQMHFRPADHSGQIDAETSAILFALLAKYRPEAEFVASKL
jgi:N-acetylmuramoyl-L-alanine amidase